VLQNNLEAAEEIGRQLRLRDIGGIIVIDFIDMESEGNQNKVLRKLRETLAKDKTRTQVFDVSHLGLVEMTRKNVSAGLLESFSEPCTVCLGRGVILHEEAATQGIPIGAILVDEEAD
jgi:ribonuclease E